MHPNERLLRDEYRARAEREDDALAAMLADDVVWHVPGNNAISGVYRGRDEVIGYTRRRRALVDGTFDITVEDVLVNDRHGFVMATGAAMRDGKRQTWRAHGLYRFKDGQIAECWVLPEDQNVFDDIWQ
jgi:hypothetical protein